MRQVKNPIAEGINTALQRPSKPLSDLYRIHVIDRAAQILESLGFDHQELSVSEIGAKTGLDRSSAHRILMALEYNDLVETVHFMAVYRQHRQDSRSVAD
jgi:DNA-binding transcriptional ArsR family regulator